MNEHKEISAMSVLHVGINRSVRNLINSLFYDRPLRIHQVGTALQGLKALKRSSYDLIACDSYIPDINGAEFLHKFYDIQPNAGRLLVVINGGRMPVLKTEAYVIVINEPKDKIQKHTKPLAATG